MLKDLTAEFVRERFTYDPLEGLLRYRDAMVIQCKLRPAGTIAGSINDEGYRYIKVNKVNYRASRVIWLYVTGEWPKHQIDHKDRDTENDRWDNLRQADSSQNKANSRKYRTRKQSCDLKGVQAVQKRHSIRYRAVATKDGVRVHLGNFGTPEEAHAAYVKASVSMHGEFASDGKETG